MTEKKIEVKQHLKSKSFPRTLLWTTRAPEDFLLGSWQSMHSSDITQGEAAGATAAGSTAGAETGSCCCLVKVPGLPVNNAHCCGTTCGSLCCTHCGWPVGVLRQAPLLFFSFFLMDELLHWATRHPPEGIKERRRACQPAQTMPRETNTKRARATPQPLDDVHAHWLCMRTRTGSQWGPMQGEKPSCTSVLVEGGPLRGKMIMQPKTAAATWNMHHATCSIQHAARCKCKQMDMALPPNGLNDYQTPTKTTCQHP
jgi:hypothetical protein